MEGLLEDKKGFWQSLRDLWKNSKTGVGLLLGSILFIAYQKSVSKPPASVGGCRHRPLVLDPGVVKKESYFPLQTSRNVV